MSDAHGGGKPAGGGHKPAGGHGGGHGGGGGFNLDLPVGATWIVLGLAVVTLLVINYQFLQAYPTIASKVVFVEETFGFYVLPFWAFRFIWTLPPKQILGRLAAWAVRIGIALYLVGYMTVHSYVFLWAKQGLRLHDTWGEIYFLAGQALFLSLVVFLLLNYVHHQVEQWVAGKLGIGWAEEHSAEPGAAAHPHP